MRRERCLDAAENDTIGTSERPRARAARTTYHRACPAAATDKHHPPGYRPSSRCATPRIVLCEPVTIESNVAAVMPEEQVRRADAAKASASVQSGCGAISPRPLKPLAASSNPPE